MMDGAMLSESAPSIEFLRSVQDLVLDFQREQQAAAMKRMRFLREDAVRRLESIQARSVEHDVIAAVDEAVGIVQQELAHTADKLAEHPVLWRPCNQWFVEEVQKKNQAQIQRLARTARSAGEREKVEKIKTAESKLQRERMVLERQGKMTEAELQKELSGKIEELQNKISYLKGKADQNTMTAASIERMVALKKKKSTEDERNAEQVMVTLREALLQVTTAVRETQQSIVTKQQELLMMERYLSTRSKQVDELEQQQRLGWPQHSQTAKINHAQQQAIARRRRRANYGRRGSVNIEAATIQASKGEGIWATKAANLVKRLGVSLETAAAALAETGGHAGLAYGHIEYGSDGSMHSMDDPEGIEALFNAGDEDGSGMLDARELGTLMHQLTGKPLSDEEMQAVLEEMDTDGDGTIELPELRHWLGELKKRGGGDLLDGVSSTAVAAAAVKEREALMSKAIKGQHIARRANKIGSGNASFAQMAALDAKRANAMRAR